VKADRDEKPTRLRIQMKKYAVLKKLPMTISDDRVYLLLRDSITGGLSNVVHRVNEVGTTKSNEFHFDTEQKLLYSIDSDNIVTNIIGVAFNSLFPSVYSGIKNRFGEKLWIPGALKFCIKRICNSEYD
jgi:hypothetical protein